jgi:hypothetical protein
MAKVILSRDDKVYRGGANPMLRVSMRASLHQLPERRGVTAIHLTPRPRRGHDAGASGVRHARRQASKPTRRSAHSFRYFRGFGGTRCADIRAT